LRVAQGAHTSIIKWSGGSGEMSFGTSTGVAQIKVGQVVVPTDAKGQIVLYDTGFQPERFISVSKFLDPKADPDLVRDKIVLIGTSAPALKDLRATPLNPAGAGVEVHAQILEQMLTNTFLYDVDWQKGVDIVYILVLGLLLILAMRKLSAIFSGPVALLFIGGALFASWFAFTQGGILLAPVYPATIMALIFITGTSFSYIKSEAGRRQVRDAFSLYLSPEMVRRAEANPEALNLGGEERDVTVMFTDIRGFTTISEGLKPAELTAMLNGFLTPMTNIIQDDRRGTVDKYMGDAIMAFWNAPLDDPDHAGNACRAALDMRRRLRELNEEWEKAGAGYPRLNIGIGLNSGPVTVGNFGSEKRFAYSIIGDAANLASRLEGQTKAYGVDILISEEVLKRAPGFHVLELDLIRVKGKREPARIYALIGMPEATLSPERAELQRLQSDFLALYRKGDFVAAGLALAAAQQAAATANWRQGYYDVMQARLHELGEVAPEGWDGVYEATSK
jgi:adenylate cyclase